MASLDWLKNRSKPTETECYELGPENPLPIVNAVSAPLPSTSTKRPGEDAEFIIGRNDPKLAYKVFSESIAKGAFGAISNDMTHTAKSASQGAVFMPFETPQEKLVKVQQLVNALEKEINANATTTPTDVSSAISSLNTQLSLISAQIQEATSQEGISTPKPAVTHLPLTTPPPSLPSPSTSSLASVEQRLHKLERLIGVLTPSSSATGITDISASLLSALRILSVLQAGSGPTVDAAVARLRVLEANIDTFSKGSAEEAGKLTEAWDRLSAAEAAAEAVQDTVTRLVSLRDAHNKVIALAALEDENRAKERLLEETQAKLHTRMDSLREAITENSDAIVENTRILEERMNQILTKLNK